MEGGRKVTKRSGGGAKDKESLGPVKEEPEGDGPEGAGSEGKQAEVGIATPQVQPVTLAGDWTGAGHGAITLVSHPALGGFTLIQTDQLQPVLGPDSAATQVIALETPSVAMPLQVPVSVSAPLSIHVPGSIPFSIPISVSLPVPASASLSVASSAPLPAAVSTALPVAVSAPLPVPESTALPVTGSAQLPVTVSTPLPVAMSVPLSVPVTSPLPVAVSAPLSIPASSTLPVAVSAPLPVPDAEALSICEPVLVAPELDVMQDPPPCVNAETPPSDDGHLGGTEDAGLMAVTETMEVSSENTPSTTVPPI